MNRKRRVHYIGMSREGVGKESASIPAPAGSAALIDVPYTTAASGPGGRKPLAHPSWSRASSQMFPAFGGTKVGEGRPAACQRAAAQMLLGFSVFSATGLREFWCCVWFRSAAVSSWGLVVLYLLCPGQGTQLPRKELSAPERSIALPQIPELFWPEPQSSTIKG